MAYLKTYDTQNKELYIQVFPSTRRTATQISARMFSEKPIVDITNKLIDTEGFVITNNNVQGYVSLDSRFEFDLYGYYFNINQVSLIVNAVLSETPDATKIYAKITLDNVPGNNANLSAGIEYQELHGQDTNPGITNDDSVYTGVEFVTEIPSAYPINEKYLLLLKLNNGLWLIPDESKYKFNQQSVKLDFVVDGGVLNTFSV